MNGHHPSWGSTDVTPRGKLIDDWLENSELTLLNTGTPTFETPNGNYTHIDLTFCSQQLSTQLNWEVHHKTTQATTSQLLSKQPNINITNNTKHLGTKYKKPTGPNTKKN